MNILQVNKFYSPYIGGVETVTRQLAVGAVDRGHSVRVLTANHSMALTSQIEEIDEVEVWRTSSLGFLFNASLSPIFPFWYRKAVSWADVVHFHVPSPLAELTHLFLGVPVQTGVVVTFHADPTSSRFEVVSPVYIPVLRRLLRRANRITATAPANAERSDLLDKFAHKTNVIPLATEFQVDPPTEEDRIQQRGKLFGEDDKDPVILFVGRLAYYKGLGYLLRAMRHIEAQLVIVGDGELRGDLEKKTRELGLANRVRFEGHVPDEHLSNYYRAADIFVLPSIAAIEAFGIVQLDAMAHGLPVINTNLPTGVPFVSQHEETGLTVQPEDSQALADALNHLVNDRKYRWKLGENAASRARDFTEEKMVDRYEGIYEEIIDQK